MTFPFAAARQSGFIFWSVGGLYLTSSRVHLPVVHSRLTVRSRRRVHVLGELSSLADHSALFQLKLSFKVLTYCWMYLKLNLLNDGGSWSFSRTKLVCCQISILISSKIWAFRIFFLLSIFPLFNFRACFLSVSKFQLLRRFSSCCCSRLFFCLLGWS